MKLLMDMTWPEAFWDAKEMNPKKVKSKTTLERMAGHIIRDIDLSGQTVTITTDQARFVSQDHVVVLGLTNAYYTKHAEVKKGAFIDLDEARFFVINTDRGLLMIQYDSPSRFNMSIFSL